MSDKTQKQRQKFSSILANNLFMIRKIAKYTPGYFVWMIIEGIIWGFINSLSSYYTFSLLNVVGDGEDFAYALKIIALMAIFYILAFMYWFYKLGFMGELVN